MNDASTNPAEDIFCAALELRTPAERQAYIVDACAGDTGLQAQVTSLLQTHQRADQFFQEGGVARLPMQGLAHLFEETPQLADADADLGAMDDAIGKTIGNYKLLQRIGEGGCGVVYMAEQEKPVRRKVAFKIIKLGMDTKSVIARFEAERQALAMMDHPNIARVLDAGATQSGRPFFVMELVRGVRITEYCDQNGLDTHQRLRLFIQVCLAIQHAHQKGVIHRDIKPSNILITIIDGSPVPKVIDFGIAKAIEGRLTDQTIFTAYEQFIGTPAYMSPEQAVMSGVDVDTRSDIYSLGVLLYELLTGRTPFETKELLARGLDGLRRTLQEEEPQRPSVMLTTLQGSALTELAHLRHAEPVKLVSLLRGDVDWIVIRALEKDRARRYQTANGLAMDIQRFLNNEPVVARPPSRVYRLQKLIRRNRVTFVAGLLVALALFVGLGVATQFWLEERQAHRRAEEAEKLAVAAEREQARLRIEAEDRERITQAAFLISQKKLEDADAGVSQITTIRPSLEAESVLRTLGQWHALNGRWKQAADRFNLLLSIDQKDNSWAITDDLLMAGPILIERGDMQGYEQFRLAAIERNQNIADPIFAERTLKISLLLPAKDEIINALQNFYDTAAASMQNQKDTNDVMAAWRCISLGLMAYRQGYTPTAKNWCQRCLAFSGDNPPRITTAHLIQALSCQQLGEKELARNELGIAKQLADGALANNLTEGDGAAGFWYDWLFARILLREAQATIGVDTTNP